MAYTTHATTSVFDRLGQTLSELLKSVQVAQTLSAQSERRLHELAALQALSDAELAERGLNRDRLAHHVFGEIFRD